MTWKNWRARLRAHGRDLILVSLLSLLPLLLLMFGFEHELAREFSRLREEKAREVELEFETFLDSDFLSYAFNEFFSSLVLGNSRSRKHPEAFLFRTFQRLDALYPGAFEVAIFDSQNQLVVSLSGLPEFHDLLRTFGPEFAELQITGHSRINENLPHYRNFLGTFFSSFDLGEVKPGWRWYTHFTSFSRKRAMLVIPAGTTGKPWIMVWISFPKNHREFLFQIMVDQKYRVANLSDLISLDDKTEDWGKKFGSAAPFVPKVVALLQDQEGTALFSDGYVWIQYLISPRKRLLMAVSDDSTKVVETARRKFLRLGLGLFAALLLFPLFFRSWDPESFSLRTKLLALFIYTTGVPIGMLFLSAQGLFHERRQIMEKKIFQEHEKALTGFDRRFNEYLGWLENRALRLKGPPLSDDVSARDKVLKTIPKLIEAVKPQLCELLDEKGASLYHFSNERGKLFSKLAPFIGVQISRTISRINGTEVPLQESVKEQTIKASLETLGFDLEEMASNVFGIGDALSMVSMGGNPIGAISLLFYDTRGKLRFIAFLAWDNNREDYIRDRLPGFQKNFPDIRLATRLRTEYFLFPESFPLAGKTPIIDGLISQQAAMVHLIIPKDGKNYLFSGIASKDFMVPFYACSTDDRVRAEIRQTAVRLTMIGVFLMGLGIGIGLLISRSFLHPIGFLSQGVAAMKMRDFSARIPVLSNDEFGLLSKAFNRMMEGMTDLEVARIVQDTFFPREPLAGCGWEVFGTSISASRVGGDYFDHFLLKDGRWLILIGDVSGHGVSASLVVAMAKALTFHPANPAKPSQILQILSACLRQTLHQKRLMSCFLAVFDPRLAVLLASNAGHNFPFLVKNQGVEEISIVNSMLGVKTRKPYEDRAIPFADVEALILYTDGIIEALDSSGNQIGYSRFQAALPGLLRSTARETEAAFRRWFATLAEPGPLADDATIVILQKTRV